MPLLRSPYEEHLAQEIAPILAERSQRKRQKMWDDLQYFYGLSHDVMQGILINADPPEYERRRQELSDGV